MSNLRTITVRDAMKLTGFPRSVVYRLVKRGDWRSVRTGASTSQLRIFEASIQEWFAQQSTTPAPAPDADALLPTVKEPAFQ